MTSLDRFLRVLFELTDQRSFIARYRLGLGLLIRLFNQVRRRVKSVHLPTTGFRADLTSEEQNGEMYRHLYFHLGCYLLGPFGWLLSWFIGLTDQKQAAAGRAESETEVRDNLAGRECGRILTAYMKRALTKDEATRKLRAILS